MRLEVLQTGEQIPVDDPWAPVWDTSRSLRVPLSAQNISPPFGGGSVSSLTARALHDGRSIFLLVQWEDDDVGDNVNGSTEFSDAVAVQFPSSEADGIPPFTMGAPDAPVNIWQWKAVWQADIDSGFTGAQSRYPDTFVDFYPEESESVSNPARHLGNPLSQIDHASGVENLIAEGFGTLTSSAVQDVDGRGAWVDGQWRALFVRSFEASSEGATSFSTGETSAIAFAVWDGDQGDRNGQKSIAQFIELDLSDRLATSLTPGDFPLADDRGTDWYPALIAILGMAVLFLGVEWIMRRAERR